MKRCLAALLLVIMTMMMNCGLGRAEETVFPADTPFADRAAEEAHLRANRAVHDRCLFEPDLYVCAMTVQEAADRADVIVAGYAYTVQDGYIEVVDLNDLSKRAVIQNGDVVESLMSDEEDDMVLRYYNRNKEFLEDMHSA